MSAPFASAWQGLLRLGFVDDRYPLQHASVQLPNGWYGVNAVISGFASILAKYEYDELLLPTISVNTVFKTVPPALKGDAEATAFPITHTGVHKLDAPYFLSTRPDLIIPQIIQITARSYRDLPARLIQRGFRYVNSAAPVDVSFVTDTEFSALDAEGIFASAEEYAREIESIVSEFEKFSREKLKLTTFCVRQEFSRVWFAILPDNSVLEVARLREYGQDLAGALGFQVLQANNTPDSPFIVNFTITARLFAVLVAVHSVSGKVALPAHVLRAFGTAYGVDVEGYPGLRLDVTKVEFTPERFAKVIGEGGIFALLPAGDGAIELRTADSAEVVPAGEIEGKILQALEARDEALAAAEKAAFDARFPGAVQFFAADAPVPDGFVAIGRKIDEAQTVVVAKPFSLQ
jgi:hypothetical protein